MSRRSAQWKAWTAAMAVALSPALLASTNDPLAVWKAKVEPILDQNCWKCHGGVRQKGGLDLRSPETVFRGGDNGPAVFPGDRERSLLWKVLQKDADPHMPPEKAKPLTPEQIEAIGQWTAALPKSDLTPTNTSPTNVVWAADYFQKLKSAQAPAWVAPEGIRPREAIDGFITKGWEARGVRGAGWCDDAAFVRRLYLDLAGRIPTTAEAERFQTNTDSAKREALVNELLAGPEYPVRMREVFDVVLMERPADELGESRKNAKWWDFLETVFRENRPWNQAVREMIVARPTRPEDKGAVRFLAERRENHQGMAEAVAPVVFGTQVKCAQCHNHPLAYEIEQRHYWALVSTFNRSKAVDTEEGPGVAESAIGGFINFANLKKESQPALLAYQNGKVVPEARPKENEKENDEPEKYVVAPPKEKTKAKQAATPKFSRREEFAKVVTEDNPMLPRAFANRMWALLVGRGLVHPADEIDSKHPASHPELLDWLGRDFAKSGYDIKRLVREIVLSRTYQLDAKPAQAVAPLPDAFAYSVEKPLAAEQLFRSWLVATQGKVVNGGQEQRELLRSLVRHMPDVFPVEYNATLQQAMFMSNSPLLDQLVQPKEGNLTTTVIGLPDSRQRVEQAFQAVLGRKPTEDEGREAEAFLSGRDPKSAVPRLCWALLTSAEFQTNH